MHTKIPDSCIEPGILFANSFVESSLLLGPVVELDPQECQDQGLGLLVLAALEEYQLVGQCQSRYQQLALQDDQHSTHPVDLQAQGV